MILKAKSHFTCICFNLAMFSEVASSVRTFSKPLASIFCKSVSSDLTQCFSHYGRAHACMNFFNVPARPKVTCFYGRTCGKCIHAAPALSCTTVIQHCQFSTETKRTRNRTSRSKQLKLRPVRTETGSDGGEKLSFENDNDDNVVANRRKVKNGSGRHRPDIVHRYMKARDRVQERIDKMKDMKENIFTIPNLLTITRIILSPVLGYLVIHEYYQLAVSLFVFTSATDVLDGWIARKFKNQQSVLGSIIDPLADKILVSILTVSLTISGLIPVLLTVLIVGRDVSLIASVFWLRFKSLPPPKTMSRYFDLTHTTVKLQPTTISKYNTAIQVGLVAITLGAPVFNYVDHMFLHALWYITATSTVLSGLSYVFLKDTFKYVRKGK